MTTKSTKKPPKKVTVKRIDREADEVWVEPIKRSVLDCLSIKPYKTIDKAFVMQEDEFRMLRPRFIHREIIAYKWLGFGENIQAMPGGSCEIYIMDGTLTEKDESKVPIAYSFYVRWENRTWKASGLMECLSIIESMRMLFALEIQKYGTGNEKKYNGPICWAR